MRKIDTSDGRFHENTPGNPIPATQPKDWWINDIQEELCNVITKLGNLELNENDNTQFAQALERYMNEPKPAYLIAIPVQATAPISTAIKLESEVAYFYSFSCVVEQFLPGGPKCIPFSLVAHRLPGSPAWKTTTIPLVESEVPPVTFSASDSGQVQLRTTLEWPAGVMGRIHFALNRREGA